MINIGSNVYLEWSNKTEDEKKKQLTGFSIDAGDVGYLRASIGMMEENGVLREIFPEEFWDHKLCIPKGLSKQEEERFWESFQGPEFDFKANAQKVIPIIAKYLGIKTQKLIEQWKDKPEAKELLALVKPTKITKGQMQQIAMGASILNAFSGLGFDKVFIANLSNDPEGKRMWAKSLFNFFVLGLKLQEAGRKPSVYISW